MSSTRLVVNGIERTLAIDPATPLLWALRDTLGLTGTKFGCGAGQCGACTVQVDGEARRACVTPLGDVAGQSVTTIEGLSPDGSHPLQRAWCAERVAQCGYCQPGQILAAAALLRIHPQPTDEEIAAGISNLCRCGTYERIRRAVRRAARAV